MKPLFSLILFLSVSISAYAEWFNVNHPDTANIEVIGNSGDTLFTFQKDHSVYMTTNFGNNWTTFQSSILYSWRSIISREGILVVQLFRETPAFLISKDCGASFNDTLAIREQHSYGIDLFWKFNSRFILVNATYDWDHICQMTKDGLNYVRFKNPSADGWIGRFIVFHHYNVIYNFNDTLFRTDDTCLFDIALVNPGITELGLCEENSKGKLFMLVHDSVFTSIDSGWTWQRLTLSNTGLKYLNIDNQDNIYLRTTDKIFCSYDDGLNWSDITENLPATTCKYPELRFSDKKIFERADDGNIYYRDIILGVEDNIDDNILKLYPNPVNSYLKIKFNVDKIYPAIIKIYSVFGESIIETDYKDNFDVSCLSPGIYFLQVGNICKKFIVIR